MCKGDIVPRLLHISVGAALIPKFVDVLQLLLLQVKHALVARDRRVEDAALRAHVQVEQDRLLSLIDQQSLFPLLLNLVLKDLVLLLHLLGQPNQEVLAYHIVLLLVCSL